MIKSIGVSENSHWMIKNFAQLLNINMIDFLGYMVRKYGHQAFNNLKKAQKKLEEKNNDNTKRR